MKNDTNRALKYAKFKEFIHPFLVKAMSSKTTGDLYVDGKFPDNGNYLIVANHLCIEDIPTLAQALERHFFLLVSDEDKNTLDGVALNLNGVQWVHRTDKDSRAKAANNAVEILKNGKNFAIYPEATWNLSPNALVMQMNYGCIRMALDANVPIIPVVTFFSDADRHTKIGNPFYPTEDLNESIGNLRDMMATMVYDEIQDYYRRNYGKIPGIYRTMFDDVEYYYESRDNLYDACWNDYVDKKYEVYARARADKPGVRKFESQFIFTPKTDDYAYFQLFNSVVSYDKDGNIMVKRISSEKNGYDGCSFGEAGKKDHFGFGYNETVLKKQLKKN